MLKLELLCIGHITKEQTKECVKCKNDELNKYCQNYKPIRIYYFDIKQDGNKRKTL